MNVTLPDSLQEFIAQQVSSGRYADTNTFVAELVRTEAEAWDQVRSGAPLPVDVHFGRRLTGLLDEAEQSGGYTPAESQDFDDMEREALELVRKRKSL